MMDESLLIDFLSTAISWNDPCHNSAHSPLFEANIKTNAIETGKKIIALVYSKTGSYPEQKSIRYSLTMLITAMIPHRIE